MEFVLWICFKEWFEVVEDVISLLMVFGGILEVWVECFFLYCIWEEVIIYWNFVEL